MLSRLVSAGLALTIAGGATLAAAVPASAQSAQEDRRFADAQARFDREYQIYRQAVDRYQSSRAAYPAPGYDRGGYNDRGYAPPPPAPAGYYDTDRAETGYDPARYYRPGGQERVLGADDRVYAGNDGRYYCKRSDGTTGLIIGGAAGGVLGNVIAGGHSKTVGTLLGAAGGALAGRAVDQNNSDVRCR
jgi:hypothetical protein